MAIIEGGLEAAVMRNKMESKDALVAKGSLYVGTGKKTTVTKVDKTTVSIPETTAFVPPDTNDRNGGVMIWDTSVNSETGWNVAKITTANLENGRVEQAAKADKILAFDGTYGSLAQACLNMIYPVGSIYMSANNVSPQTFLGGTWEPWGAGRVPVGVDMNDTSFSSVEKTGGEKTHVLSPTEMPRHEHSGIQFKGAGVFSRKDPTAITPTVKYTRKKHVANFTTTTIEDVTAYEQGSGEVTDTVEVEYGIALGGNVAHNNLQPYITCFMWKRVS